MNGLNVYVYGMSKKRLITAIASIALLVVSCTKTEKLPPPVSTVEQAKTLLTGKVWQVVDVGFISGLRISVFDNEQSKKDTIVQPATESVKWLSAEKKSDDKFDITNSFYEESLGISIGLNKDSIATTTGLEAQKQVFSITDESEENEPKGIKLLLTGESKTFADMGASKVTATYYILGASEKKLYLLTPNTLNRSKVVFLLEAK